MKLPGRLSGSTLGDVLGALYRAKTTGQLELCELFCNNGTTVPGRRHRIHLVSGMVSAIESSARVAPLGETLRRLGFLDARAIERLVHRLGAGDARPAGEILADGEISAEIVDVGLRQQLRDKLDALYAIEDASLAFRPPRPLAASARKIGPLTPRDFLHGRPRARDKVRSDPRSARQSPPPSRAGASHYDASARDDRADALRTLGLPPNATLADVRRAFRRLAVEMHPDRHPATATSFARVTAAYHRLVG